MKILTEGKVNLLSSREWSEHEAEWRTHETESARGKERKERSQQKEKTQEIVIIISIVYTTLFVSLENISQHFTPNQKGYHEVALLIFLATILVPNNWKVKTTKSFDK